MTCKILNTQRSHQEGINNNNNNFMWDDDTKSMGHHVAWPNPWNIFLIIHVPKALGFCYIRWEISFGPSLKNKWFETSCAIHKLCCNLLTIFCYNNLIIIFNIPKKRAHFHEERSLYSKFQLKSKFLLDVRGREEAGPKCLGSLKFGCSVKTLSH